MSAPLASRRSAALRAGVLALLVSVLHVTLSAYACGDPIEGLKSEGEPCTRSSECASSLSCTGGVCRGFDAGPPRPPVDAGRELDAALHDGAIGDGAIGDGAADDGATEDAALEDAAAEDADDDAA